MGPGKDGNRDEDWDIYNTKERFRRQLKSIKSWNTCAKNKDKMLSFLKRIELEGIGIVQRTKYVSSFKTLLNAINKDFENFTEQDLETLLSAMKQYKPKTKCTRWYCIKKFFRYIGKEAIYNTLKPVFGGRETKLPEQLLTQEEVKQMIDKAPHLRDKAIISVLYESGCRIGELLSRRIKHIVFDQYGAVMVVDGKTGMRRVRLISSVPLLANWTSNHPHKENQDAFLWTNLNDHKGPVGYRAILKMLCETAERAGVKKKIYPHLFRHSRATHLANKLTEQQLKGYFGWTGGSKMAAVYVHLSGRDIDNAILEVNGVKQAEIDKNNHNGNGFHPITCPRCSNSNDPSAKFCNKCGMVLKEESINNIEPLNDSKFKEFLLELYEKWKETKVKL